MAKTKPKNTYQDPTQLLMDTLHFNEDDLEANRNGELSESQRTQLDYYLNKFIEGRKALIIGGAVIAIIAVANTFFFRSSTFTNMLFIVGLVLLGSLWFVNRQVTNTQNGLQQGRINSIQGVISLDLKANDNPTYYVNCGALRFTICKDVFLAFKNNEPYVLYYVPWNNKLLSAEIMSDGGIAYDDQFEENSAELFADDIIADESADQ